MCRDCGCSLGPAAHARAVRGGTRRRRARPRPSRSSPRSSARTTASRRTTASTSTTRRAGAQPDVLARRGQDRAARGDDPRARRPSCRVAVVEGDLATENDADRIRACGVPAVQITTGNACHLDAQMVHDALHDLPLADLDVLFIENVGNLVCPASFDLGQHRNITLLSVPEGDDKPAKYPVMFRAADLSLITKTDLLPYLDRVQRRARARGAAPDRLRRRDDRADQPRRRRASRPGSPGSSARSPRSATRATRGEPRGRTSSPRAPARTPRAGRRAEEGER